MDVCLKCPGGGVVRNTAGPGEAGSEQRIPNFKARFCMPAHPILEALCPRADFSYTNFSHGRDSDFIYTTQAFGYGNIQERERDNLRQNADFENKNMGVRSNIFEDLRRYSAKRMGTILQKMAMKKAFTC